MSTVHVVPLRDLIEHDVPGGLDGIASAPDPWLCIEADGDGECACGPKMEAGAPGRRECRVGDRAPQLGREREPRVTDLDDLPDDGAWLPPTQPMTSLGLADHWRAEETEPWLCPRCPGKSWTDPREWAEHIRDEHGGRLT